MTYNLIFINEEIGRNIEGIIRKKLPLL